MKATIKMTGRLIAAARALTGVSQEDFAAAAGLHVEALRLMEASGSAWLSSERDAEVVSRGLAHFGVIVVEEFGRHGRWRQTKIHPTGRKADRSFGRRRRGRQV